MEEKEEGRVIKFRAWDGERKTMIPVQGLVFDYQQPTVIENIGEQYKEDVGQRYLMQFTGLHDKNGKEIYEGDILTFRTDWGRGELKRAFIDYRADDVCHWLYFKLDKTSFTGTVNLYTGGQVTGEVIGNIYETPELLAKQGQLEI